MCNPGIDENVVSICIPGDESMESAGAVGVPNGDRSLTKVDVDVMHAVGMVLGVDTLPTSKTPEAHLMRDVQYDTCVTEEVLYLLHLDPMHRHPSDESIIDLGTPGMTIAVIHHGRDMLGNRIRLKFIHSHSAQTSG
jgi:hypothetical protein